MANSSQHFLGLIAETVYGTTPATPTFAAIRNTGTTLGMTKDSILAQELRSDRNISDQQFGVRQIGGDITTELSDDQTLDDMLEGALGGTWNTGTLKNGVTRRSFTIVRHFTDITTDEYQRFTGCEFNTLNVQNTANDRVQMTFGVIGQDMAVEDTAFTGSSEGSPTTTAIMTGVQGSVTEGGAGSSVITEVNFTVENGLEIKPIIGSNKTLEPSIGRFNVTGQATAYFEDGSLLDKFVSETASSLVFVCTDGSATYTFNFFDVRYTGGDNPTSGQGAVTLALPFQAVYSSSDSATMSIVKA